MRKALTVLILLFCCTLLASCRKDAHGTKEVGAFQIVLLDDSMTKQAPGLGYSIETSWPLLKNAYPSKTVFRIDLNDIESYDWTAQIITISAEGSKRFLTHIPDCASMPVEQCLDLRPFVVVYNDTPVYGGIFLSSAPIETYYKFPVIYPSAVDEKIKLSIQPNNALSKSITESDWNTVMDEKVKKVFVDAGKIVNQ